MQSLHLGKAFFPTRLPRLLAHQRAALLIDHQGPTGDCVVLAWVCRALVLQLLVKVLVERHVVDALVADLALLGEVLILSEGL